MLIHILTRQLRFDVLRRQPDKLLQALNRLAGHLLRAELFPELCPRPLGDRHLVFEADILAVVPQQPRFLVFFQLQDGAAP